MSQENARSNALRLVLFLAWFIFIASTPRWMPAYHGDIDRDEMTFVPIYGGIAALAAITTRRSCQSPRDALMSVLPGVVVLGVAAVCGVLANIPDPVRGGTLYLYFGAAVWSSWSGLMLATAYLSRTKWNGLAGLVVTLMVAVVGLALFIAEVD
jgi:hypothetical protein